MEDLLKILLLEDDADDAEIIQHFLAGEKLNCKFRLATGKNDYLLALDEFYPDIILSDHSLPQFNSEEAYKTARQRLPDIPFIMITGAVSDEHSVKMIRLGVDDYILKDRMARLPAAIIKAIQRRKYEQEKREAERRTAQSEANLRTIFENTSEGFLLLDKDAHIMAFNTKATEYVLLGKKEFRLGQSIYDVIEASRKGFFEDTIRKALHGESIQYDRSYELEDGHIAWIDFSITPVMEAGQVRGICISGRDITEKKKIEQEREFERNNLKALMNNTDDLMWSVDRKFRLIASNDAFDKMIETMSGNIIAKGSNVLASGFSKEDLKRFRKNYERAFSGYAREEILKLHGIESFFDNEEDKEKTRQLLAKIFEKGSGSAEVSPLMKDGKPIHLFFSGRSFKYEGKTYLITTGIDITERKKAEEALQKSEDYLRLVTDTIPALVWSAVPDGALDFINQRHQEFTGLSLEDVKDWRWTDLIHPDDRSRITEEWRKVLASGKEWVTEARLQGAYGDYRWLLIRVVPLHDELGKIVRWYGTKTDITELKRTENELQQSFEEIRRLTEHLQKIREEERKYIAREIHDELGQQLTAIKMDVAWVDKKIPAETFDIKRKIKNIIELLDGSNQSIRRILSELRPQILGDHGLLEAIEWLGIQFTETTGIAIEFTTPEKDINVSEQIATSVFRICQEAFTNITRHSHAKNISVSISIVEENIILSIEDDGIGFDPASVQSIKSFGILGMRERVISLGGKFDLVSSPGRGTKITVGLPYKE